jgi:hypothetical protein
VASPAKPAELGEFGKFGDWKLKIENWKKILSFQAGKNYQILFIYLFIYLFFRVCADAGLRPRGRVGGR